MLTAEIIFPLKFVPLPVFFNMAEEGNFLKIHGKGHGEYWQISFIWVQIMDTKKDILEFGIEN